MYTAADSGLVRVLIESYINQLCGKTPNNLCMGVPATTTNFVGLEVTLNETQGKAVYDDPYLSEQDKRKLEDLLEV
jgi:hypothetical protein